MRNNALHHWPRWEAGARIVEEDPLLAAGRVDAQCANVRERRHPRQHTLYRRRPTEAVDGINLRRGKDVMANLRELAAIELRFLNRTFVLLEYAFGVILLCGIGLLGLIHSRGHSLFMWYLVSIGVNYIPLFYYAILLVRSKGEEMEALHRSDMARLRRQQLWLLVPFAGWVSVARRARH